MKFAPIGLMSLSLCLWLPTRAQTESSPRDSGNPKAAEKAVQFDTVLHDEIIAMSADDQKVRKNAGSGMSKEDIEEMKRVDKIHENRMKEIIAQHGWPGKALVGSDGSNKAWLVVQHCSPSFQEECLPLLERAVAAGEATGKNYAYLLDRVRMHQGKPQIYGTQFRNHELWMLEDPEHVDERRRSVGLGTLAEYTEQMNKLYKKPNQALQPNAGAAPSADEALPPRG